MRASLARLHIDFDPDSTAVTPTAMDWIRRFVAYGGGERARVVWVFGSADPAGDDAYNLALSERRAQTVADILIGYGWPEDLIVITTKGEDVPHTYRRVAVDGVSEPKLRPVALNMQ